MDRVTVKKGDRYGKMTIVGEIEKRGKHRRFLCVCDCGEQKEVYLDALRRYLTTSCGCWGRERATTHGDAKTPLYRVWESMKNRCLNPRASITGAEA